MPEAIPYFDGHNDALLRLYLDQTGKGIEQFIAGGGPGHIDLPRAKAGHFVGGLFATFPPPARGGPTGPTAGAQSLPPQLTTAEAWTSISGETALLFRLIEAAQGAIALCRDVGEIRAAMAAGQLAAVLHMEGAEAIDDDLYALDVLYAAGLRSLGLVWSRQNAFGTGVPFSFPGTPDIGPGLTEAGKRLVEACNRKRILIDLSHLNEQGFWDVAKLSTSPLVATHSNVHALCPTPRNLTERQLDAIRDSDGFVGLNFANSFLRPDGQRRTDTELDWMVRHLDALIEKLGEDRVGLGSDFDGTSVPDAIRDVAGTPALFEALRSHGYDDRMLRKIGAENWLTALERIWG